MNAQEILAGLRQQHKSEYISGVAGDAHNHKPVKTKMRDLYARRSRRTWNVRLKRYIN